MLREKRNRESIYCEYLSEMPSAVIPNYKENYRPYGYGRRRWWRSGPRSVDWYYANPYVDYVQYTQPAVIEKTVVQAPKDSDEDWKSPTNILMGVMILVLLLILIVIALKQSPTRA
jgi:hypothetical protein